MKDPRYLLLEIHRTGTPVQRFYDLLFGRAFVFIGIGLILTLNHIYLGSSVVVDIMGSAAIIIFTVWCLTVKVQRMNAEEAFDFLAHYLFADRIEFLKKMHPDLMDKLQKEFFENDQKNQLFDNKKPGNY